MRFCIDLGGTNMRLAILEGEKILSKEVFSTNTMDPKENLEQIYNFVKKIGETIDELYICCPGPLSENNDMIVYSPNLPGWNNYPFKKEIEEELGITVHIINDANAATIGEAYRFKQYENILYFTISTGFGGGFTQQRKIYSGEYNTSFEIEKYIVELPKNLKYGSLEGLESLCSGTGIYKLGLENGLNIKETKDVFDLANENNEIALTILDYVKTTIVKLLKNMCYVINPGVIVLGGSVILHNEDFFESIKKQFRETQDILTDKTLIEMADKKGESGLLGLINI